jgi:hypothetical protein
MYGERKGAYRVWWGNLREGAHLEDPSIEGRVILRRIFRKLNQGTWTGLIWLRIGISVGLL